jgi:hypothetical protein
MNVELVQHQEQYQLADENGNIQSPETNPASTPVAVEEEGRPETPTSASSSSLSSSNQIPPASLNLPSIA